MSFRSAPVRILLLITAVAAFGVFAFGDTIRLKDGSILKGKIVGFSGGRFTLAIGDGSRKRELSLSATEIESIEFDEVRASQNVLASNPRPAARSTIIDRPADPVILPETANEDIVDETVEDTVQTVEASVPKPAPVQPSRSKTPTNRASAKPIALSVKVLADDTSEGWTNSGWIVKAGQKIRVSGSGEVSIGSGKKTTPSGLYDVEDEGKLLKNVPTGALIAVIGDDNNEFIYIGSEREFTATRDGALFLGVNEGNLKDNSGSFDVKIEIAADGDE